MDSQWLAVHQNLGPSSSSSSSSLLSETESAPVEAISTRAFEEFAGTQGPSPAPSTRSNVSAFSSERSSSLLSATESASIRTRASGDSVDTTESASSGRGAVILGLRCTSALANSVESFVSVLYSATPPLPRDANIASASSSRSSCPGVRQSLTLPDLTLTSSSALLPLAVTSSVKLRSSSSRPSFSQWRVTPPAMPWSETSTP
mmetsp:Transcript_8082/g.16399  ORF Transcript_8082/g.16399 Transcript_8082/m.16399 type:complete len:204 (-) Transcript_8082:33-644(-)